MSWPADGGPRFIVRGDPRPNNPRSGGWPSATVLDRGNCYHVVRTTTASTQATAERMARVHADHLNEMRP